MEHRLNCKIVQDLLPNYIEGLKSDITNKAIEDHLSTCAECKRALEIMTRETKEIRVVPQKQINFLKKIKRRQWRITSISVLISVMLLIGAFYFFSNRDFAVPSRDVTIGDVYQMSDGSIHYNISANVKDYVSRVSSYSNGISEIIGIYEHRRFGANPSKSIVSNFMTERWSPLKDANANKEKSGIYYEGKDKNDRIVIWEKGMTIPKATAEQEPNIKIRVSEVRPVESYDIGEWWIAMRGRPYRPTLAAVRLCLFTTSLFTGESQKGRCKWAKSNCGRVSSYSVHASRLNRTTASCTHAGSTVSRSVANH